METHGVEADRVSAMLTREMVQPRRPPSEFTRGFLSVLPFLALGLAYAATQYAAFLKVRPPPSLGLALHLRQTWGRRPALMSTMVMAGSGPLVHGQATKCMRDPSCGGQADLLAQPWQ